MFCAKLENYWIQILIVAFFSFMLKLDFCSKCYETPYKSKTQKSAKVVVLSGCFVFSVKFELVEYKFGFQASLRFKLNFDFSQSIGKLCTKAKRTKVQKLPYSLHVLWVAFSWWFVDSKFHSSPFLSFELKFNFCSNARKFKTHKRDKVVWLSGCFAFCVHLVICWFKISKF